jgi:hypothetical protein
MTEETTSVENENASGIKKTLKEDSKALELALRNCRSSMVLAQSSNLVQQTLSHGHRFQQGH